MQAASYCASKEFARFLLENGANINAEGGRYGIALQAASACGDKEVVRFLLEHEANVNAEGGCDRTPLEAALSRGVKTIMQLLLDHGVNVNADAGDLESPPLQVALKGGVTMNVQLLLDKGAIVNERAMKLASNSNKEIASYDTQYLNVAVLDTWFDTSLLRGTLRHARPFYGISLNCSVIQTSSTNPVRISNHGVRRRGTRQPEIDFEREREERSGWTVLRLGFCSSKLLLHTRFTKSRKIKVDFLDRLGDWMCLSGHGSYFYSLI